MLCGNGVIFSVGSEDLLKIVVCCNMTLSALLEIHEPFFYPEGGGGTSKSSMLKACKHSNFFCKLQKNIYSTSIVQYCYSTFPH